MYTRSDVLQQAATFLNQGMVLSGCGNKVCHFPYCWKDERDAINRSFKEKSPRESNKITHLHNLHPFLKIFESAVETKNHCID